MAQFRPSLRYKFARALLYNAIGGLSCLLLVSCTSISNFGAGLTNTPLTAINLLPSGTPIVTSHPLISTSTLSIAPETTPSLIPARDRIVFVSGPNLEVIDSDGNNLEFLVSTGGYTLEPAWSPDGQFIAFVSGNENGKGVLDLYLINIDGSGLKRLTNDTAMERQPAWSPDSKYISYTVIRDSTSELYVFELDSGESKQIQGDFLNERSSSWSPDGKYLAFLCRKQIDVIEHHICLTSFDGQVRELTPDINVYAPLVWSPDGRTIVFNGDYDRNNYAIYTVALETNSVTQFPHSIGRNFVQAWSPDGRYILFVSQITSEVGFNNEIYRMNFDGTNQIRLTNDPAQDYSPTWSSDSQQIAFVTKRENNEEVCVMGLDGSNLNCLTNNPDNDNSPIWSP